MANTPSHLDDVKFDANSFSGASQVVTIDKVALCKSMDWTGTTNTPDLAGSQSIVMYEGSVTFIAAMTASWTGSLVFRSSSAVSLTTNGLSLNCTLLSGNGQYQSTSLTLQDALTTTGDVTPTSGTFNTNGKAVTCGAFARSTSTFNLTITLGASVISCSSWGLADTTGLTFNCGTSAITMTSTTGASFEGGGLTYYTVNLVSNANLVTAALQITGANTFGTLTLSPGSSYGSIQPSANQVVSTLFQATGANSTTQRLTFGSPTAGTAYTVTCNGTVTLTDVDFTDITGAGSGTWSGTRVGDRGGNSGITFTTGITCYWTHPGGASAEWTDSNWYAVDHTTPVRVPLPQDDVVFDAGSFGASGKTVTVTTAGLRLGRSIDWTGSANTPTWNVSVATRQFGSLTCVSGMTLTIAGASFQFMGRGAYTINTGGKTFPATTIQAPSGTYTLAANFTCGSTTFTLQAGTFTTSGSNYSLTCGAFTASGALTRALSLNASSVSLGGSWTATSTGMTLNAGTSTITVTVSGTTFAGGGLTYYNLTTSQVTNTMTGANTFNNLTLTPGASVGGILTLGASQVVTGTLTVTGNSAALNRVLVASDVFATARTITCAGTVALTNADFRDITAAGGAAGWGTGTSIGNCGGNTGITMTPAVTRYWMAVSGGNWGATSSWSASSNGATGASVPLPQDTAIIDDKSITSGSRTITINMPRFPGFTCAAVLNTPAIACSISVASFGSITLGTVSTTSGANGITFGGRSAMTLTSNGVTWNFNLALSSVASLTLADALTLLSSRTLTLTQGTLDLNSKAVSIGLFSSSNSNTRVLTFGTSVLTLSGTGTVWNVSTDTGLTLNAGTGKIVISDTSGTAKTFTGSATGALTYYDLDITGGSSTAVTINGSQTWHTVRVLNGPTTVTMTVTRKQVCTNFTATGTAGNLITFVASGNGGYYLGVSGTLTLDYCAASDMRVKAGTTTVTHLTDNGRNYGIGTDATRYWVSGGSGYADDTSNWSATSGGASGASVPTGDVVFDANSGSNLYIGFDSNGIRLHSMTCTGSLNTFFHTTNLAFGGDVTLVNRWIGFNTLFFRPQETTNTLTTNGTSIGGLSMDLALANTLLLGDNLASFPSSAVNITGGSFDANGKNVDVGSVSVTGSNVRSLTMGSGTWTVHPQANNVTTLWNATTTTNLTFNAGTSTIVFTSSGPTSRTFAGGGLTYNNLTLDATATGGELIFGSSGSTYNNLTLLPAPYTITFGAGTTRTVTSFTAAGTSGNLIALRSDTAGSTWTISQALGTVLGSYLSISDSIATGGATWRAGRTSTDGGNNTGWSFTGGNVYWIGDAGTWGDTAHWSYSSGGATSGALPGSLDQVFFDAGSFTTGSQTVTVDVDATVVSIDFAGVTHSPSIDGSNKTLTVSRYLTLATGMTASAFTGTFKFTAVAGSRTITTAGRTLGADIVIGDSTHTTGTYTLQDALTTTGSFTHAADTLNTGNFDVTCAAFSIVGTLARTLNLGTSTLTCTSFDATTSTNLVLNVTSGTIKLNNGTAFHGGGLAYGTVWIAGSGTTAVTVDGANTIATLKYSMPSKVVTFLDHQTVTNVSVFGDGVTPFTVLSRSPQTPTTFIFGGITARKGLLGVG